MIELDGIEYQINTPEENASNMVTTINTWCQSNNIQNRKGDLIQIEANYANPLYVILFGIGYLMSAVQNLVYSAGCALNIQASSDKQLLNIADIAGIKRKEPTKTSITCIAYSELTGGDCRITTALSVTVTIGGETVIFHPAFDISIPAGASRTIVLVAETLGSYSIAEGTIQAFDENPEQFRALRNMASVPGQSQETIPALRLRIQRRADSGSMLDKAVEAIEQLEGVSVCNIYFNNTVNATETVMGIEVPPRQSLIFVQGFSLDIAKTYWQYMDARCAGASASTAVTQTYTTRSGQALPVYIIPPTLIPVYIRLYFNSVIDDSTSQSMRDAIATIASSLTIGQLLTSTTVVDVIQDNFVSDIAGCQLSLDDSNYSYQVQPGAYELLTFSVDASHIQIISVGV